jgi:hypothetical protein
MTRLTYPQFFGDAPEHAVQRAAMELLGEAMRDCPEEPIETFFGISPNHAEYEGTVKALDALGVEWRRS